MKLSNRHDSAQAHGILSLVSLLLAWLFATVWGTVVQTQWNLQALAALGVDIPLMERARTSLQDLMSFAPIYGGIVAAGWLPALIVAVQLARRWPRWRMLLLAAAAGLGVVVAVRVVDALAPMPVFIDATRHWPGLLTMAAGAAIAGLIYGHRTSCS